MGSFWGPFETDPESIGQIMSAFVRALGLVISILFPFVFFVSQVGDKSLRGYRVKKLKRDWKLLFYSGYMLIALTFLFMVISSEGVALRWLLRHGLLATVITALLLATSFYLLGRRFFFYLSKKDLTDALVKDLFASPQGDEQVNQFWEVFNQALSKKEQTVASLLLKTLVRKTAERTQRNELFTEEVIGNLTKGLRIPFSTGTGDENSRIIDFIKTALIQIAADPYWKSEPGSLYSLILVYFSLWRGLLSVKGSGTFAAKYYLSQELRTCLIECTKELSGWEDFLKEGEKPCSTLKAKWKEMVDFLSSKDTGLRKVIINELQALISPDSPPCLKELVEHLRKIHHG